MPYPSKTVLIIDDDVEFIDAARAALAQICTVRDAASLEKARLAAEVAPADIVFVSDGLPEEEWKAAIKEFKCTTRRRSPHVILTTSDRCFACTNSLGAAIPDDFVAKPVESADLRARVKLHFRLREAENRARLCGNTNGDGGSESRKSLRISRDVSAVQDLAVFTLAKLAESRDNDTGNHLKRIRAYAQAIAEELKQRGPYTHLIDEKFLDDLYRSSPLHDIGKVGIPDDILQKPGSLTPEEWKIMRRHTVIGANILDESIKFSDHGGFLAMASVIARFHHERWDGRGYPAELVGREIPLPARIVSVADVYDALTSKRPYKDAFPPAVAKAMIDEGVGTQFDPAIVAAFNRRYTEFARFRDAFQDEEPTVVGAASFLDMDLCDLIRTV
jgi:putative two-component system response regulator